jgi:hypothetical protein
MMQYRVRRFFGPEIDQIPFYLVLVACLGFIVTVFACSARAQEYDTSQIEHPAPPSIIRQPNIWCANGQRPSCHPVNDNLCWNWCDTYEFSIGDVYHWPDDQGRANKWKVEWKACGQTVAQQQVLINALRAKCGRKCRGL